MQFFKKPTKLLAVVSAAILGGVAAFAPTNVNAQDIADEKFSVSDALLGDADSRPFDIGGWTQIGYHNESNGVFNTHPNDIRLHQQWLYLERVADGSEGLDFGFRADLIYGVDAQNTQAFGNPPGTYDFQNGWDHGIYGWALPQLYAEVAMGDLSVKAGHFYTIIGYETVTAPDNFFYSHAFTFNFNEPFTHTGVLATYQVNDNVTAYGGYTWGWDTGFEDFNDGDNSDGSNWLGGVSVALTDNVTATLANVAGDFGLIGEGYMQSFVLDVALTDKLNYVFQNDWLHTNAVGSDGETGVDSYSFNQYLFYTINDNLRAGARGEIWTLDKNTIYQTTLGVNVIPHPNVVIRPEVRWQWGEDDADEAFFGNQLGIPTGDTIFGVDAILTY